MKDVCLRNPRLVQGVSRLVRGFHLPVSAVPSKGHPLLRGARLPRKARLSSCLVRRHSPPDVLRAVASDGKLQAVEGGAHAPVVLVEVRLKLGERHGFVVVHGEMG